MNQTQRLHQYLRCHGEIEPLKAWQALGIYRLGARIWDLRRQGVVMAVEIKAVRNRFGDTARVAHYRLAEGGE